MSAVLTVGLAAAIGGLAGLPVTRWLQRASYRRPCDAELAPPGARWWVVPVLGLASALLTWRVWCAPAATGEGTALDPGVGAGQGAIVRVIVTLALGVAVLACGCLAAIDLDVHRLPDRIIWPTMGTVGVGLGVAAIVAGEPAVLARVLIAGVACGGGYLLLALVSLTRGSVALGLGDVKLAVVLGMALGWFGWQPVVIGMYAGFLAGGAVALLLLVTRRVTLHGHLAYGPPMMTGALLGLALPPDALTALV